MARDAEHLLLGWNVPQTGDKVNQRARLGRVRIIRRKSQSLRADLSVGKGNQAEFGAFLQRQFPTTEIPPDDGSACGPTIA
jgi:hypothetical protein